MAPRGATDTSQGNPCEKPTTLYSVVLMGSCGQCLLGQGNCQSKKFENHCYSSLWMGGSGSPSICGSVAKATTLPYPTSVPTSATFSYLPTHCCSLDLKRNSTNVEERTLPYFLVDSVSLFLNLGGSKAMW